MIALTNSVERPFLSLLGGFECSGLVAGSPALTRKARAMMAYLALQVRHSQSREKIAALLWGGASDEQARASLRQTLSVLRRALQTTERQWFRIEGDQLGLDLREFDLDVTQFEVLAASSETEELKQAIALYSGELLEGFSLGEEPFEDWLRAERERLRTVAIAVLEKIIFRETAPGACIGAANRLLGLDPLREDIHRIVMGAYEKQGRINLALEQYQRVSDALRKQLGVQPEPETRVLYQKLLSRRMVTTKGRQPEEAGRSNSAPPTYYVKSSGINIAYQVTGDGPFDLVYVQGWVSNLDYAWVSTRLSHTLHRLGSFCRLIRIDKRGTGLSDRTVGFPTLEERMQDIRAVLDAIGSRSAVLFGSSEGGLMCMLFAASYPERTTALILHGAYARGLWSPDYPWGRTEDELEDELATIEREWGRPADLSRAAPSLVDDPVEREWFAAYLRNSASPKDAISLWRWSTEIDARDILSTIRVPTLITHGKGDRWVHADEGRFLASRIPHARYVELPSDDHVIWGADSDRLIDEIQGFLSSATPTEPVESALMTVLHVKIPKGYSRENRDRAASGCGGESWQREATRLLATTVGQEIELQGTKLVAGFRQPTQAINYAFDLRDRLHRKGMDICAAVHIGECERQGNLCSGPVMQLAALFADYASPGEILTSQTVRDLTVGANLSFDLRGQLDLSGIPGQWPFFSVGPAMK